MCELAAKSVCPWCSMAWCEVHCIPKNRCFVCGSPRLSLRVYQRYFPETPLAVADTIPDYKRARDDMDDLLTWTESHAEILALNHEYRCSHCQINIVGLDIYMSHIDNVH